MKTAVRGFTLIELMTAILVLGVLLAMAIPSYREMTRNNRVAGTQNDLITSLAIARSEALHRSRSVTVCASSNGTSCTGVADWVKGWIVFTDAGTAGSVDSPGDESRPYTEELRPHRPKTRRGCAQMLVGQGEAEFGGVERSCHRLNDAFFPGAGRRRCLRHGSQRLDASLED